MDPPKYLGDPNPALWFTFHFQDGAEIRWRFEKPWDQVAMFAAIGRLGAEHELGIAIDLPEEEERVSLDEDDFKKLVAGEELVQGTVRIILTDIGWGVMESAIRSVRLASQQKVKCPECGRVFNLLDENDAQEWAYGHDCEV